MTWIHNIWCGPIPESLSSCFMNSKLKFKDAYQLWCFSDYFREKPFQSDIPNTIQFLDMQDGPQEWLFKQDPRWIVIINVLRKLRAFSSLKDIFEIVVLYLYGGFYLDTTIDINKTDLTLFKIDESLNPHPRFLKILSGSTSFSRPGSWASSQTASSGATSLHPASQTPSFDETRKFNSPQRSPRSPLSGSVFDADIFNLPQRSPRSPLLKSSVNVGKSNPPQNSPDLSSSKSFDLGQIYSPPSFSRRCSFDGVIDVWMGYSPPSSPLLAKILHYIFCAWWYGCEGNNGISQPHAPDLTQLNFKLINQNWLKSMLSPTQGLSQLREDTIGRNIIFPVFLACSEEGSQYIDDNFWDVDFTEQGLHFVSQSSSELSSDRFVRNLKIRKTHCNSWRNKNLSDLQEEFFMCSTNDPTEWWKPK